jgi:hypothetical protein
MRNYLVNALKWLLSVVEVSDEKLSRARTLVTWADAQFPDVVGERKRHQVISKLAVEFPDERLRDLSYLIEKVLQEK